MIHEQFNWPTIPGRSLEQVITLGRCGSSGSFYDLMQATAGVEDTCQFCNRAHLKGDVLFENDSWFVLKPPGEYNHHSGVLSQKYIIVLKEHTNDPSSLTDKQAVDQMDCRRYLKSIGLYNPENGGASLTRHGTMIMNAGTIAGHYHENVDEPNGLGEVRPPIYKDEKGWEKDFLRLNEYLSVYKDGMTRQEFIDTHAKKTKEIKK